ncbi:hypothetical protein MKW92_033320 [Papaver armeniacum]|nr:hypothetical protein MKW92_033320 [Papaver armeniacum]
MKNNGFPPLKRCASSLPPLTKHRRSGKKPHALADNELLVCEILSRLPVKSLMRFKSVCKHWRTLIQKDWRFIDLHFMRSQSHRVGATSLLIRPPTTHTYGEHCFLLAELLTLQGGGDRGGAIVHTKIPDLGYQGGVTFLQPVNGLFCFIDIRTYCVCIYNPSTRESTPWIKSAVKQQQEDEGELIEVIDEHGDVVEYCVRYVYLSWKFGYDPTTKEHKVIWIWVRQLINGTEKKEVCLCEVLTVRHNSWRIIDTVPPVPPSCLSTATSVYANGSIYWLLHGSEDDEFDPDDVGPLIVEFKVGIEKFRVISIPNFIINDIRPPYNSGNGLMEVDGRLVLLARKIRCSDYDFNSWIKNTSTSMRMCILNYNHDRDKGMTYMMSASSGSSTSSDYWWIEDSFLMPQFDWKPQDSDCVLPIPGTDLFIVRSSDACSFYYYNWKQKSYSGKFGFNGFNSFIDEKASYGPFFFRCFTFQENLFPVK